MNPLLMHEWMRTKQAFSPSRERTNNGFDVSDRPSIDFYRASFCVFP
jgi:hypothetical protein